MPASDFGWAISQQAPLFQVYGKKRKHDWSDTSGIVEENEGPTKRQCPMPVEVGNGMTDLLEINHNSIPLSSAPKQFPVTGQQDMVGACLGDIVGPVGMEEQEPLEHTSPCHQQNVLSSPAQKLPPTQPNTMIMDLCDETYSTVQMDAETESMYSSVDGDCVPNQRQYGISFCDNFCVGGDQSPTSGRVRCYCKPSWEGLMEMRPYISDYY